MTPLEFLGSIYARLMRRGIPMREIDGMDVVRYLDVLAYELKDMARERRRAEESAPPGRGGMTLTRGSVDMLW